MLECIVLVMTDQLASQIVNALCYTIPPTLAGVGAIIAAITQGRANNKQTADQTIQIGKTADALAATNRSTASALAATTKASVAQLSDKVDSNAAVIVAKADQIHDLTNSNLTLVKERLQVALARIEELENQITRSLKK